MAVFTHTIGEVYKTDAGTITNTTDAYTGPTEYNYDGTIAASTTNHEIDLVFPFASVISCVLFSDLAVTIKTNSTSSPGNTITLAAGKQKVWNTDHTEANPFAGGDVTKLYITNASGTTTANIKIRVLTSQA